ncbi:MAG TPA: hypothetical protein VHQ43_08265 [Solirubrobacterales bacterium]|nr:hypothetical protein [Solirubrobacterales bacterium]
MESEYRVWASLEGIDISYGTYFDHLVDHERDRPESLNSGVDHAGKLNLLAAEICREAEDDDLLMFLDGDAFPIADPAPLLASGLADAPLMAVRRAEVESPHPHPCFCVTDVGTWRSLPGDWSKGFVRPGLRRRPTSDVGSNLLRQLELSGTPWSQVLRSNRRNLHPLLFAVYGDTIYHHGAGFRRPLPRIDMLALKDESADEQTERGLLERNERQSAAVFERIEKDEPGWLAEFI